MERNLNSIEIRMEEINNSHLEYLCDIVEEICTTDRRAARLLYVILDKLGKSALDDIRLEKFIDTHMPGRANYKLLLDWVSEIQREPKKPERKVISVGAYDLINIALLGEAISEDISSITDKCTRTITIGNLLSAAMSCRFFKHYKRYIKINNINVYINEMAIIKAPEYEYRMKPSTFIKIMYEVQSVMDARVSNLINSIQ